MGSSNRFDTSEQQQYVSTRVPMPFEAIGALGAKMQQKYDTAIGDTYKLNDLMANVPAIHDPQLGLSNIQKKAELDAKYHPRIDALAAKIAAGDPNANRELEQVKRDFTNDPDRQELENSYLNYKAYKEDKVKKADKYAPWEDQYINQQLIDPNTGELKQFRYSGMGEVQDHQKLSDDMMKGFVENSTEFKTARLGADGIIRTNFGKGAAITDKQIRDAANAKTIDFIGNKEGISFLKQMKFQYPNATPEQLQQMVSDKLYHSGMNQIHNNSGGGNIIDVTGMANDIRKEKKEFDTPMPTYQNPVQGLTEPATPKSGLGWLGINTDILDDNGKPIINNEKQYTGYVTQSGEYHEPRKKSGGNNQQVTKFYTNLISTARGLGLEIPKQSSDKSKTDFNKLQKQLADYGQNMQIQGNTSAGLQSRFGNNLSDELLGKVTADSDGNTIFKKSPILEVAKIVDQSTGEVISKDKEEIAKDGAIRGINYFAPQEGTYKMDSKNKSYDYNPGDATLNAMTKNTHSLTQDILKARQGKQNHKTILTPESTQIIDGKIVKIPAKTVGDYANTIVDNLKDNFKSVPSNNPMGLMLANHLNENLTKLNSYEPVSIKSSDILTDRGTPKYNYVAYQHKGFGTTNDADDKVLRVDAESGQTEVMTLGDIHASERDYLQRNYAGAFEQTKQ